MMDSPSTELVRLMQQFVPQLQARYYPVLIPDHDPPSIAEVLDGLHTVFASHFGEARVTAALAVPVEYLAYLMVVQGTLTDRYRSQVVGGRRFLLGATQADSERFRDPPPPPDTLEIWQTADGRAITLPHSGATVQLEQRRMWLSIGEEGERSGRYLCADQESDQYGWVVTEDDDHPWFRHNYLVEGRSFLAYLRHIVSSDAGLVDLLGQMESHGPPPQ
jgi:hypothetical protein